MIHSKELRYGNKVKTRQGDVITVQQILCNSLIYDRKIEVNRQAVNVNGSYQSDYVTELNEVVKEIDYNEVEPIALTVDILRKCGFRNYIREQWILSIEKSHIDFDYEANELKLRNPAPAAASIKYLHQLQNFLFALSTHELEVEL